MYQVVLQRYGFTEQLKYTASNNNRYINTEEKKERKTPPHSMNFRTIIHKIFSNLNEII